MKAAVVATVTAVEGADVTEGEAVTEVEVVAEDATNNFPIVAAVLPLPVIRTLLRTIHVDRLSTGGRIRRMGDEKLSLLELKRRGQTQGFTKIQRLYTSAKVPLEAWSGFATESGVYYVLSENQVTVFKKGNVEAHYLLS